MEPYLRAATDYPGAYLGLLGKKDLQKTEWHVAAGQFAASCSYGAAPLCRRPSSLGRDALLKSGTSASPARACGFACLWETLAKHRVYAGFRPCG